MSAISSIPVGILLERRLARVGRWTQPQWDIAAIVGGRDVAAEERRFTLVADAQEQRQYLFSGLTLRLYKDACESYWYNLMSDAPRLFVVCFEQEEDERPLDEKGRALEVLPVLVTASQDEAGAHMESDDHVYSVPMPMKIHQWLEQFVVEHYTPEQKKKRKRRNWSDPAAAAHGGNDVKAK